MASLTRCLCRQSGPQSGDGATLLGLEPLAQDIECLKQIPGGRLALTGLFAPCLQGKPHGTHRHHGHHPQPDSLLRMAPYLT